MKRKLRAVSSSKSSSTLNLPLSILTFFLGVIATFAVTQVFAQTADTNQIYACVNNTNGNVRVITSSESCKTAEKSIKWSVQGPPGPQGPAGSTGGLNQYFGLPFICNSCTLFPLADRFKGKDFSYAQIQSSEFQGADLTGVIFKEAHFRNVSFRDTNLTGADFSDLSKNIIDSAPSNQSWFSQGLNLRNANLTNATFAGSIIHGNDFRDANFQNVNFSNTKIRQSNFLGATNMSTANLTGAVWVMGQPSTCPDGTNSDSNGGTCVGHF